jgi:hypothetical protein
MTQGNAEFLIFVVEIKIASQTLLHRKTTNLTEREKLESERT